MNFTKLHGAGNDYLYVDARNQERDWPALSVAMSDRHTGAGSDGIILVLPSEKADLRMRMFNADGSESEMCGNGIRCFVRFALDEQIIPYGDSVVSVETGAGILNVNPILKNGEMVRARVSMGEPVLIPSDVPVDLPGQDVIMDHPISVEGGDFKLTFVSMGNPHAIAFIEKPVDDVRLTEVGPLVEHHQIFPNRVNFEIANVLDRGRIKLRVWERGSGITLACGTGACATAVAARLHGYTEDKVAIELPGGELTVEWPGHGPVILEGPVAKVFEGEWPE